MRVLQGSFVIKICNRAAAGNLPWKLYRPQKAKFKGMIRPSKTETLWSWNWAYIWWVLPNFESHSNKSMGSPCWTVECGTVWNEPGEWHSSFYSRVKLNTWRTFHDVKVFNLPLNVTSKHANYWLFLINKSIILKASQKQSLFQVFFDEIHQRCHKNSESFHRNSNR